MVLLVCHSEMVVHILQKKHMNNCRLSQFYHLLCPLRTRTFSMESRYKYRYNIEQSQFQLEIFTRSAYQKTQFCPLNDDQLSSNDNKASWGPDCVLEIPFPIKRRTFRKKNTDARTEQKKQKMSLEYLDIAGTKKLSKTTHFMSKGFRSQPKRLLPVKDRGVQI